MFCIEELQEIVTFTKEFWKSELTEFVVVTTEETAVVEEYASVDVMVGYEAIH